MVGLDYSFARIACVRTWIGNYFRSNRSSESNERNASEEKLSADRLKREGRPQSRGFLSPTKPPNAALSTIPTKSCQYMQSTAGKPRLEVVSDSVHAVFLLPDCGDVSFEAIVSVANSCD